MKKIIITTILFLAVFVTPAYAEGFSHSAYWDGTDIIIKWENCQFSTISKPLEFVVKNETTGEAGTIQVHNEYGSINLSEASFIDGVKMKPPKENDRLIITAVTPKGYEYNQSIYCDKNAEADYNSKLSIERGPIPIFSERTWPIIMFWYTILVALSGIFVFLILIKGGYQYMFSRNSNPGMRASFIETLEKCVIAMVIIMAAPLLIGFLVQVNDAFVTLFAKALNNIGTAAIDSKSLGLSEKILGPNWVDKLIAWPLRTIFIEVPNTLFGLHPLSDLIFNGESNVIDANLFSGYIDNDKMMDLGNPLATVIVTMALAGFNLFFNAVYVIRRWVVVAVMIATPLIVWIWVLSARKEVIELWASELFQTIFMQTWHALTFAIIISVLIFGGSAPDTSSIISFLNQDSTSVAQILLTFGKWIASFGGIVCVGIIIFQAFRLITVQNDEALFETKQKITRALIGLIILALSLMITQALMPETVPILQPSVLGGGVPEITVWQLFWALFAIIPISKMLSYIFMSLLARIGTVDENMVALKGMGMLAGLGTLGKVSANAATGKGIPGIMSKPDLPTPAGGKPGVSNNDVTTGSGSATLPNPTSGENIFSTREEPGIYPNSNTSTSHDSMSVHSRNDDFHNEPKDHEKDHFQNSLENPFSPTEYKEETSSKHFTENMKIPEYFAAQHQEEPGIYPTDSVYASPPESSDTSDDTKQTEEKYFDAIKQGREKVAHKGDPLVKATRASGYLAGSFVGAGAGLSKFFGAGGNAAASVYRTYSLGRELYQANKGEQRSETLNNLKDLTGRSTSAGVLTQGAATLALSPLGDNFSAKTGVYLGKAVDFSAKVGGNTKDKIVERLDMYH